MYLKKILQLKVWQLVTPLHQPTPYHIFESSCGWAMPLHMFFRLRMFEAWVMFPKLLWFGLGMIRTWDDGTASALWDTRTSWKERERQDTS